MKLKGKIEFVEEVDRLLSTNTHCQKQDSGSKGDYSPWDKNGQGSSVFRRQYIVDCEPELAMVMFDYDYRRGSGMVQIRDDKVWKVVAVIPAIARPMSKLEPYYSNKLGKFVVKDGKVLVQGGKIVIERGD